MDDAMEVVNRHQQDGGRENRNCKMGKATSHAVGTTEVRKIVIELKERVGRNRCLYRVPSMIARWWKVCL